MRVLLKMRIGISVKFGFAVGLLYGALACSDTSSESGDLPDELAEQLNAEIEKVKSRFAVTEEQAA